VLFRSHTLPEPVIQQQSNNSTVVGPLQFDTIKDQSNVTLNASNRSLSSNEYNNSDQALSLSYPIHYKSTIAPRQTVISRRATTLNDRAQSNLAPYQSSSSNIQIGSAPISMRSNNNAAASATLAVSSSSSIQSPTSSALK
jgi:hypothetical protein